MKPFPAAHPGGARARRPDHRHDRRAGRRLRPDRLPGRPDRRAVHRVRLHAGRRGHHLGDRRADALADDVLAHAEAARRDRPRLGGAADPRHRPRVRLGAPRLFALAEGQPQLPAGHGHLRRARAGQHLFPLHRDRERARAAGGPGRHHRLRHLGAQLDHRPAPALLARDLRHRRRPQGDRPRLPARRARPVDRGLRPEAVGQAHA